MSSKFPAALAAAARPARRGTAQADAQGPQWTRRHRVLPPASTAARSSSTACRAASRSTCPPTCHRRTRRPVFMFHGSSGTGEQFLAHSGWREQADRDRPGRGLPDRPALPDHRDRPPVHQVGRLQPRRRSTPRAPARLDPGAPVPADDVGFVDDMLADLEAGLPIDAHRIYASGFSNGAGFAARLSSTAPRQFAAVAYSGGGAGRRRTRPRGPSRPTRPSARSTTEDPRADRPAAARAPARTRWRSSATGGLTRRTSGIALRRSASTRASTASIAEPHSTTSAGRRQRPGVPFAMLEGVTHQYPNGANNPTASRPPRSSARSSRSTGCRERWLWAAALVSARRPGTGIGPRGSVWGKNNPGPGLRRGGQPLRREPYAPAHRYLSLVGVKRITPRAKTSRRGEGGPPRWSGAAALQFARPASVGEERRDCPGAYWLERGSTSVSVVGILALAHQRSYRL